MLSVKIEFFPLDWYSSSPTAIVLYKRIYMCKIKAFYNYRPGSKNKMADNPGDHVASYMFKVYTGT